MSLQDRLQFGPHLDVCARTSAGTTANRRLENQDNLLIIDTHGRAIFLRDQQEARQRVPGWTRGYARVAVLDGMGGHGQGREAAEAVVAGLLAIPACATLGELASHLDALHTSLQHHFAADGGPSKRPGTTLTMLELRPELPALLYHVGDSRLYELADGVAKVLTVDHVPATAFAMAGLLDEREWWQQVHGEHRSQISQAFILGNAFADPTQLSDPLCALSPLNLPPYLYHLPDRRAIELRRGAIYLLATDGFWSCRDPADWIGRWPDLMAAADGARGAADALFAALEHSPPDQLHPDNVTAVVLRVAPVNTDETALPLIYPALYGEES